MNPTKALSNGWARTVEFLRKPVPLPSLGMKKKRRHTHYHYSHKRAQTVKTDAPHSGVRIYATTQEPETADVPASDDAKLVTQAVEASESPADTVEAAPEAAESAPVTVAKAAIPPLTATLPGKILMPEKEKKETKAEVALKTAAIESEDGWMRKVMRRKADHTTGKWSAWSLLKERLFQPVEMPSFLKAKKEAPVSEPLTKEEIANDSFLQRVQKKKVSAPVGTQVDIVEAPAEKEGPASTLASFASDASAAPVVPVASAPVTQSRILPPLEKKKDEPAPVRREEPAVPGAKAEEKKPEEAKPVPKIVMQKKSSALSNYIASLNYMGLGKERMLFIQNMATMLNAGLPLIDALRTILVETHNKSMRKLVQTILASVENGSSFWRAMDDRHFFSLHAIALVRIGEESGSLAENMEYLSRQEEKDHELKGKVKMAMIYPSIVMTIMFILVIGLGWFVLPNLIGVLYSLGVPLPFVTRAVIAFTNFFTNYGTVAVPGLIGFIFVFTVLNKICAPLKVVTQWAMFHVPGIGQLAREATIARFGVILGGLLKAGVPVIEAVQSLIEVTPIIAYRKLYTHMLEHISVGDSFSKSFQSIKGSEKLLPPSVQQLVVTGEKSGSLADIMLKVADIYDKKASETAQKLPVVLEPLILLFIGGLVGTIAFAIIVPIYGIVGSVGR